GDIGSGPDRFRPEWVAQYGPTWGRWGPANNQSRWETTSVTGTIVSLADARARRRGWSKRELAHFQRAANILLNAGMAIETDAGVSDEGDPWFVFCDAGSGDVFAHFPQLARTFLLSHPLLY